MTDKRTQTHVTNNFPREFCETDNNVMIYLLVLFLASVYADICSDLNCSACVGASGICCGQVI
jgi:hypothetical protein